VAGEVVAPVREAHGDLAVGPQVELGGPPGTRPGPAGEPAELGDEQPLVHQPVEMVLRGVPGHLDAVGRLVPAHRLVLGDDEPVEGTTDRVGQGPQAGDAMGERVVGGHAPF
jgi:hypothetical protein